MPGLIPDATGQAGGGMENPFGIANSLMDFQNKANQNKKFQAEFMANQAFGEIMAHAPSVDEGLKAGMSNPLIAGFGQEALTSARNWQMLQAQTGKIAQDTAATRQEMGNSGYDAVVKSSMNIMNDPLHYNEALDAGLQGVDPSVRGAVKSRIDAIRTAIGAKIQGLNMSDPTQLQQAKEAIKATYIGMYAGANGDPNRLATFMPDTRVDEAGNVFRVPSPIERAEGAAPTLSTTRPTPAGTGPQGGPAPTVTNSSSGEQYPLDISAVDHYMNLGPDGKPAVGAYGRPVVNPKFAATDQKMQEEHDGPELHSYNADKGMLSSIAQMQSAADDLTAKGGFTTPGFMGVARGQIASAMETVENITGKKFTGDASLPAANADVQTINKWHGALSFQLKNMLESTGARGLGVLMEASSSVPSMENTPLAFKVLTSGLSALANWDIGKYEFKEAYRQNPRTGGSLLGSDLAYNKVSSPLDAAKNELGKIGVVLDGSQLRFKDDASLKRAYTTGLFGKPGTKEAMAASSAMYKTMHPEQYK